jgi:hypothetical protein
VFLGKDIVASMSVPMKGLFKAPEIRHNYIKNYLLVFLIQE